MTGACEQPGVEGREGGLRHEVVADERGQEGHERRGQREHAHHGGAWVATGFGSGFGLAKGELAECGQAAAELASAWHPRG